ncbi:MAG: alpha/beta hydrolase [Ilumatobacteraceae bacterium]|nr:alpha/beta hydrolase [Ilumatobacteraceae bacterium]
MNPTAIDTMAATLPDFRGGLLIPDAGHWTQQEQPEVFNAALLNFLQTI